MVDCYFEASTWEEIKVVLQKLGIAQYDNIGNVRSTLDILDDLSREWLKLRQNGMFSSKRSPTGAKEE